MVVASADGGAAVVGCDGDRDSGCDGRCDGGCDGLGVITGPAM